MNINKRKLAFYPVEEKHRGIILDWFDKTHVKQWFYGEGLENTRTKLHLFINGIKNNGEYSFEHWIAYIDDQPFGFLMTSFVEGPYNPDDHINKWYEEGKKLITLDLLIGAEEYLGKGLGHQMIQEFLIEKFSHVDRVLIDPSVSNTRAIHVYEKAGFRKVEQFPQQHDDPNPSWMMHLDMKELLEKG
ncbi:MAG: GNAT family N-acetyltransferase [Chlamydiales bacterium]|nr:GNAT family N-acetyltransferase [Chlamydiia bacterium]MCP5507819.1 GNAT family N-acetyltransferase [Chlamydiales bacterium]